MKLLTTNTEINNNEVIKMIDFMGKKLFFSFPLAEKNNITDRLDPFIYALIFPMMEIGGDFYFDGNVSRSVLDNLEMFCKIWCIWCPEIYKPIVIHANEIDDEYRPNNKKMISAFSGGLDAAYTAYKYKNKLAGRKKYDLEKSIMVHGADIPLKNNEEFDIAFSNAKKMTDDLEIVLVPVKTNFREIFNSNWEHCFGAFMVCILSFFSKIYPIGAFTSDYSIHTPKLKWGQNIATDSFLSSINFNIIVDGYEHSRTERAGFIKNWEIGINNLRVCWRNEDKSKNCGYCEKCIRTKLNFLVNGINNIKSMPTQFTFEDLKNIKLNRKHFILYYDEILNYALENNFKDKKLISELSSFIEKQNNEIEKAKKQINEQETKRKLNLLQNIFSVVNEYNNRKHKIITILGIKFKIKVKNGK